MTLRRWQQQCINQALHQYREQSSKFFVMATPGAGKTRMAAELAKRCVDELGITLVICLTPSRQVASSFKATLEATTGEFFDGKMGARGEVLTYQQLLFLKASFWQRLASYQVMLITDEIHHCGGHFDAESTQWAKILLTRLSEHVRLSLSLSGTPWRTDGLPVTLAPYSLGQERVVPHYLYPLQVAIDDGVCRCPQVVVIDNDSIEASEQAGLHQRRHYTSIQQLLNKETMRYQYLLEHQHLMEHVLRLAVNKLKEIRKHNHDAGGLIVASSVSHAYQLAQWLETLIDHPVIVVTHTMANAQAVIEQFKHSDDEWIIAVGMISEGTDIPRLQVCCHLSRIKTELYFRQVLGRILRRLPNEQNTNAFLYTLAEENLVLYAERLSQELPDYPVLIKTHTEETLTVEQMNPISGICPSFTLNNMDSDITPFTIELSSESIATPQDTGRLTTSTSPNIALTLSESFFTRLVSLERLAQNKRG